MGVKGHWSSATVLNSHRVVITVLVGHVGSQCHSVNHRFGKARITLCLERHVGVVGQRVRLRLFGIGIELCKRQCPRGQRVHVFCSHIQTPAPSLTIAFHADLPAFILMARMLSVPIRTRIDN